MTARSPLTDVAEVPEQMFATRDYAGDPRLTKAERWNLEGSGVTDAWKGRNSVGHCCRQD